MTGKEALDELMESFYELCEECNCNEDMYQKHNLTSPHHIIRKELDELIKYKRAFEILKDYSIIPPLEDFRYSEYTNCYFAEIEEYDHDYEDYRTIHYVLEKEEYELLEELLSDE